MEGSAAIAATIAHAGFWILLALGIYYGELRTRGAVTFLGLWLLGSLALPRISVDSGLFVPSWIAVLDIALVFVVFKRDIRLT
jgi:hypothetical protein